MKSRTARMALTILISSLLISPVWAADLDAKGIINKMKEALEPEISCTKDVVFTLRDHDKVTATWGAREGRKKLADGKRTLLVMLEPNEVKGGWRGSYGSGKTVRPSSGCIFPP